MAKYHLAARLMKPRTHALKLRKRRRAGSMKELAMAAAELEAVEAVQEALSQQFKETGWGVLLACIYTSIWMPKAS